MSSTTTGRSRHTRRSAAILLTTAALAASGCTAGSGPAFDPDRGSITDITAAIRDGDTDATEVVRHYLDRVERYDGAINAVIAVNPRALAMAAALDDEEPGAVRPLHGVPFVVKDNIDVEGMATTGGSSALRGNVAADHARVVENLVDAGVIPIAKVNLSEMAESAGRFGYSSAGGLTRNPYNLQRSALGSSSGTGAAVAADFAPFGLGTDTTGSVRGPASATGQVGLRPTTGATSARPSRASTTGCSPRSRPTSSPRPTPPTWPGQLRGLLARCPS